MEIEVRLIKVTSCKECILYSKQTASCSKSDFEIPRSVYDNNKIWVRCPLDIIKVKVE